MNLPDEYLANTAENGLTGEWTYTGPDKCLFLVDAATGAFLPGLDGVIMTMNAPG